MSLLSELGFEFEVEAVDEVEELESGEEKFGLLYNELMHFL
jgi:hypothetical protein